MRKLLAGKTPKAILLVVSLLLVMALSIGGSLAWLTTSTAPVVNTFTPGDVTTTVVEEIDNGVKNNVQIQNTGSVEAYVRAQVIVTWQNDSGNVNAIAPKEGTDYTIIWSGTTGENPTWFQGADGYYYCKAPVVAGGTTAVLFTDCKPVDGEAPQGYNLCVEILSSAIQAVPATTVESVWPVTVGDDGTLSEETGSN